jgi:hypothetical protein
MGREDLAHPTSVIGQFGVFLGAFYAAVRRRGEAWRAANNAAFGGQQVAMRPRYLLDQAVRAQYRQLATIRHAPREGDKSN